MVEKFFVMVAGRGDLVKFLQNVVGSIATSTLSGARNQGSSYTSAIPIHPKNSTNSAKHVDRDVAEARGSTWNETLVKLVADGIEEHKDQGKDCVARRPFSTGFIL